MNLFKKVPKKILGALAALVAIAGISSVAIAGFGPDRPTKVWSGSANGFDHVVFNSFVNVPNGIGDERDFMRGGIVGSATPWIDPVNDIKDSDEVEVKIYIHNNASPSLNDIAGNPGVAKDVNVKVELPSGIKTAQEAKTTISSSNAQPQSIFDTLSFTGVNGSQFQVDYVAGSAVLHTGSVMSALSDTIVTSGVNIGDQKGCFEYIREITFRVKITKPGYQIQKSARIKGEGNDKWRKEVNAKIGDQIEWEIYFANIGSTVLSNVAVVDDIPTFHTVVPGSIKLYNAGNPNGYTFPNTAIQANGDQVNIGISDYAPGANAYIYITTKINDVVELRCGVQQMANVVYVTPQGLGTLNDNAKVNVINDNSCDQPETPVYACTDVKIEKLGGRKIKTSVSTNSAPANRVSVVGYEYNFGDGSTPLTSTANPVEYTFAKDGTYNISVKVTFRVDGVNQTVGGANCAEVVTFTTTTPPKTLPSTGAGSTIGMFMITSLVGMFIYRGYAARKM